MSDTTTKPTKPGWLTVNGQLLGDDDHIDVDFGKLWRSTRWQNRLAVGILAFFTLFGILMAGAALAGWIVDDTPSCPAGEVRLIDIDSLEEWGVADTLEQVGPGPVMPAGEL